MDVRPDAGDDPGPEVAVDGAARREVPWQHPPLAPGLQQVEVALDETEIRAPFDGLVTTKYVEEGAMVSQGMPLVAIQDPLDNWINLKVKETELSRYSLQQVVRLQGRDNLLTVKGTIVDISKKAEFATYRSTNERNDNDIITFNVKIQVNADTLRPGMRFKLLDGEA